MIKFAEAGDAEQIALIHSHSITEGFLPKLGIRFLTKLYTYLIKNEIVLADYQDGITGFVSCATNTHGMMKRFIVHHPAAILDIFIRIIKKPSILLQLLETYRATKKSGFSDEKIVLPVTELLSIAVNPLIQHRSVGTGLLKALETELINRRIASYKVIAGEQLSAANKFYIRNGFTLLSKVTIHKGSISNVYIRDLTVDH